MSEDKTNADEFSGGLAELRAEYKKLKAENKELRSDAMGTALSSLGLEADKGIGKAVSKMYDGPISVDAIKAYASEEFGLGDSEVAAQPSSDDTVVDNTVAAQQRVQNLQSLGVSEDAKDIFHTFQEVLKEADGNVRKSITAKLQMMEGLKQQDN
jgi:hypothetical protein